MARSRRWVACMLGLLWGSPGCPGPTAGDDDSGDPTPELCSEENPCTAPQVCGAGGACGFAVCASGLTATWPDISERVLSVSCGTGGQNCHSPEGSVFAGGLDMSQDPWTALMGPDGHGAPAQNVDGTLQPILRVAPGDPDASLLVLKLESTATGGGATGRGMPEPYPGSVCPDTQAAIRAWVAAGAAGP